MDSLPYEILGEIMIFLDAKDVFQKFCLVSKYFYGVTKSAYHLTQLISHKLHICRPISLSLPQAIKILKKTKRISKIRPIEFLGFGTTGGVDGDISSNWVGSLYFKNSPGYCSRERKDNINCAGVLSSTQSGVLSDGRSEVRDEIARIIRNNYSARHLIGKDRLGKKNEPLNYIEEAIFRHIYINAPEALIHRNANQQTAHEFMIHVRGLHDNLVNNELILANFRKRADDPYTLIRQINYENGDKGKNLFCAKYIEFSRSGEFTCPVEAFIIFVSDYYIDIESSDFSIYNDLKSSRDIDNLISINENIPKAYELVEGRLFEYRLFNWTKNPLKPLLWGKFRKKGGKKIDVFLRDNFSGAYLYVKLLYPLDLMRESGDMSEFTNIDARYVGLRGIEIKI